MEARHTKFLGLDRMGGQAARRARDQGAHGNEQVRRDPVDRRGVHQQLLRLQRVAGNRAVSEILSGQSGAVHRWEKGKTAPTGTPSTNPEVKKALDHFARADKKSIEAAANAYAKREKEKTDVVLGHGVTGKGKAKAAVQAGAWGSAEVADLVRAYGVLVNVGVVVGAGIKLEGELEREFGSVTAKLKGAVEAFAGAYAKASGRVQVGISGISGEGNAEAFAGAKSSQKAAIEFSRESLGLEVEATAEEMAGAEAKAEGSFGFSKSEIGLAGEASAFAGAKAKGSVGGKVKLYGRDAFKGKVSGEVSAGAGGEARGGFRIRRGVIALNIGGNVTVGVGGGGAVDLATDLKPVAVWIWRQIDKARWKANFGARDTEDTLKKPDAHTEKLRAKIRAYGERKIKLIKANRADNFVKEEKVQQIIGNVYPRKQVKGHANASNVDQAIKKGVEDGLNEAAGRTNITATIKDGKLLKLTNLPQPKEFKGRGKVGSGSTDIGQTRSVETGEALHSILLGE